MRAAGALPTEERVQKMNDLQWLWYYRNIVLDEDEDNKSWQERLDYMGWWINPKMAEGVMNIKNGKKSNINSKPSEQEQIENAPVGQSIINVEGNVVVNDSFEAELQKALAESGQEVTVLPESGSAGNAMESKDDFIARAMEMQNMFANMPSMDNENIEQNITVEDINIESEKDDNLPLGFDPDDIDYFEFPDEE